MLSHLNSKKYSLFVSIFSGNALEKRLLKGKPYVMKTVFARFQCDRSRCMTQ